MEKRDSRRGKGEEGTMEKGQRVVGGRGPCRLHGIFKTPRNCRAQPQLQVFASVCVWGCVCLLYVYVYVCMHAQYVPVYVCAWCVCVDMHIKHAAAKHIKFIINKFSLASCSSQTSALPPLSVGVCACLPHSPLHCLHPLFIPFLPPPHSLSGTPTITSSVGRGQLT